MKKWIRNLLVALVLIALMIPMTSLTAFAAQYTAVGVSVQSDGVVCDDGWYCLVDPSIYLLYSDNSSTFASSVSPLYTDKECLNSLTSGRVVGEKYYFQVFAYAYNDTDYSVTNSKSYIDVEGFCSGRVEDAYKDGAVYTVTCSIIYGELTGGVKAVASGIEYDSANGGYAPNFTTLKAISTEGKELEHTMVDGEYSYYGAKSGCLYKTNSGTIFSNMLTTAPVAGETYYSYILLDSIVGNLHIEEDLVDIQIPGYDVEYIASYERDMGFTSLVVYSVTKLKPDVYVGGVGMCHGDYLAVGATKTTTTKPSGGYAYYKDGVLTLNNFNYSGSYNDDLIESDNAINLVLVGKNTLATTGTYADGIGSYDGSVNISGAGSLNISATDDAIYADGNVTVTDATVTINGGDYGISAYGNVTLDNATLTMKDVEHDGIYTEYSVEIKDSTVNIACGDSGIYACGDLTVTGSTFTVNADADGLYADNVTITGSTVTATSGYGGYVGIDGSGEVCITGSTVTATGGIVGIEGSDEVCITGSTVTASGDGAGIYGYSGISITDSDVIAKSTATEDDGLYWAIYVNNGSVTIDSNLKIQASTEPNGTLGTYDPAKHNTYDYIKITRQTLVAPTIKVSNVASTGKIKLSWNKVDGAAKYEVYRATSKTGTYSLLKTLTGTSLTNTSVDVGKTYYYKIRAVDANGNKSEFSSIVSRACDLPQPVVTASNVASTGKVKLSWTAVEGAAKYEVYRATSKDGTYTKLSTTTNTTLTNTSTTAGTTYYYKVKAIHSNSAANSAYSSVVSRACDLPQPTGLTATNVASTGKVKLTWTAVEGAAKYEVYRATSKDGTYTRISTTTNTTLTNTSTTAGTTYYYKVKAIHSNSAANSAYSSVVSRTCDLAQPKVTVTNVASTGKVKLSWTAVEGAAKYEIYRATSKDGTYTKLSTTTNTTLTNTSTTAGTTYYYKVKAIHSNSAANSAYSTVVSRTCDLAQPTLTVKLNSSGKPVLTWTKVEGAVSYKVYRATSKDGTYSLLKTLTGTTLTNTSVTAGKTYYYKVIAVHSNTAANSAYSAIKSVTVK